MSCEVVHTASIRVLILCLLTCVAYLVIFKIDMMCTRVVCCDVCVVISWFILVLMLWMSFCGGCSSKATEVGLVGHLQEKVVNFCNGCVSVVGLIAAILWQMLLLSHQSCRCPGCWTILVEVLIIIPLGLMDVNPEI